MKTRTALLGAIVLTVLAAGIYILNRNSNLRSGFDQTIKGELRSAVIARMGPPSASNNVCHNQDYWLSERVTGSKCVTEIIYDAKLLPKSWAIGFDRDGRAVTKYEYVLA